MKAGRAFLLIFLLPVLVVAGIATLINFGVFYSLKQEHNAGVEAQRADLATLSEAIRLSEDLALIQQRVANVLRQADAGLVDEAAVYRVHAEIVNTLGSVTKRVAELAKKTIVIAGAPDVAAMVSDYESYRNYVIMATDIAAIDPKRAGQHISQARDHFISFSQRAHHIATELSQRVESTGAAASTAFEVVLRKTVIIVITGLLVMLILSWAAARAMSRRVTTLADALGMLAHEKESPPPLPAVQELQDQDRGEFSILAGAVLSFRQALIDRRQAEMELIRYQHSLEEQVAARTAELAVAKDAAEAASVTKSDFLANMSHEIRTPMNGILGMANILRREGVTPQQAQRLDTINTSAQHLLSIINNILDISKIEADKLVLEEAPVVIGSLLANVSSILSERAKEKGIRFLIEAESLPRNLVGDPTRLQQALINYAINAIKFTEKGTVTLRTLLQEETAQDVLIRFEVQDTGIGIAPETLSRLFSAFEQADNSMTRKYGGTGLGLSITRRLAGLMGGAAGAESTPGAGSTFWFTVRLKKGAEALVAAPATEVDAEAEIRQRFAGRRILVADDEPINREVALMQLEDVDLVVDTAEDGVQAVALAQETAYAAIFMDMQMPNLNGLEATQKIRQLPKYRDTPIIAMTANAFAEDKAKCLEAGMNDFLIKPFNPDQLFAILLRSLIRQDGQE